MAHTFLPDPDPGPDPELRPQGPEASARLRAACARLDELVDWELRDRSGGEGPCMRQSVAPAADLLERLGSPEKAFRRVHVAGTKGKGSVASLVAAGLRRHGLAEGIYASPHVERLQERVRLRGREVEDGPLAEGLELALAAREAARGEGSAAREATWFDVLTAAAAHVLSRAGVEWAVLECGLGGRLDSTRAIGGEVAVVTNVDLEHTALLGRTRAAIAAEKAAICRPGATLVHAVGPPDDEAARVVEALAAERGAELVRVPGGGTIEQENARVAGAVLDVLGGRSPGEGPARRPLGAWLLDEDGLREARLPGRLERGVVRGVPVVLDGAHVPSSLARVMAELAADPALPGRPTVVLAAGRDKDAPGLLKVMRGQVDRVLCTVPGRGPYRTPDELRALADETGLVSEPVPDPRTALEMAIDAARSGRWALVTGSLHLVGSVRASVVSAPRTQPC